MAKRDEAPRPLAIDVDAPPVGAPRPTDGVVSGVALNRPTDGGPTLAVDPDETNHEGAYPLRHPHGTIPERARREGPLAIRDLDPEPPRRRTSPRFKLPKG